MKQLKGTNKIVFFLNSLVAAMLLMSYLLPYVAPKTFAFLSVLSLAVPLLIILNVLFVLYWFLKTKKQLFIQGPFEEGTNNIGEFLALVHGLAFLKQKKSARILYTDSRTALSWVKKKKCNTKLQRSSKNESLFVLVDRAVDWLDKNSYTSTIVKWETKAWGEIPADFGRK